MHRLIHFVARPKSFLEGFLFLEGLVVVAAFLFGWLLQTPTYDIVVLIALVTVPVLLMDFLEARIAKRTRLSSRSETIVGARPKLRVVGGTEAIVREGRKHV